MRLTSCLAASAFAVALLGGAALAPAQTQAVPPQTPPSPTPPSTSPRAPQATPAVPGDSGRLQDEGSSSPPGGSLSDDLSRSHGVVKPPATGDKSVVPPPNVGGQSTPVIPPPGTPGGTQNVQPK